MRKISFAGGMNKSRAAPNQGKRVSPPTVPGLVSFQSFRVKKTAQNGTSLERERSTSSLAEPLHGPACNNNKETQRYSGSSLGSAGSSYTSSGSSSDNRSSIATDDGYLPTACSHQDPNLKHIENGVVYKRASQHVHILKDCNSVESFVTNSSYHNPPPPSLIPQCTREEAQMPQDFYNKVNGISSSSTNGVGNGNCCENTGNLMMPQHVTVHVDPHTVSANVHLPSYRPQPGSGVVNGVSHGNGVAVGNTSQQTSIHAESHGTGSSQHGAYGQSSSSVCISNHFQAQISLEDAGIDMTQSPGRESPSSTASSNAGSGTGSAVGSVGSGSGSNGCRHSTASYDSGRASSTIYQHTGVRYSGLSSESSSGSFRHSYHSSSSSLGSIAPEDICSFDVAAMIAQGVPDHEVLNAWLTGIHFEGYYQNFVQAGYDMQTISRMTPEDLNAVGVTKPHHRKRLKSEISQLNISDGLPEFIPSSVEEWLSLLKLEEYTCKFRQQGYHSVRQVTNITWEDLEDLGVLKLGHQKKFMLAIKRIEDILAGKRIPNSASNAYLTPVDSFSRISRQISNSSQSNSSLSSYNNSNAPYQQQNHSIYGTTTRYNSPIQSNQSQQWRPSTQNSAGVYAHLPAHTLVHQPQVHHSATSANTSSSMSPPQFQSDVVSIQVKNGRRNSMENVSSQEPIYGTSSFQPNQKLSFTPLALSNGRSISGNVKFEEGDTTPTNECIPMAAHNGIKTCTLPRSLKHKPSAKYLYGGNGNVVSISERCQTPMASGIPQMQLISHQQIADGYKSLPRDIGRMSKAGLHYYSRGNYPGANNTLGKSSSFKNGPPPPPRRGSCSGAEASHYQSSSSSCGLASCSNTSVNFSRPAMPPPPPALSCDQFQCPPSASDSNSDEFPAPPPPDELLKAAQPTPAHLPSATSSKPSLAQPSLTSSTTSAKSTTNYTNAYTNGSYAERNHLTRKSPSSALPSNKSRDPSPVNGDLSDSDLSQCPSGPRGVRRNGSDASFKSNSSTESESIPFANDNAGTIKQQKSNHRPPPGNTAVTNGGTSNSAHNQATGDVLNDIGNMLADLTDELDAILEQEKSTKS